MSSLLRVRDLSVTFAGGVVALDGIDLDFAEGERTVLVGRSGAGKSTLLRCLNGLQAPTRGQVEAEGIGVLRSRPHWLRHRRQTGMVFQSHHLLERWTALDNVLLGRIGHHRFFRALLPPPAVDTRLAYSCLERVGLAPKALIQARRLSGGERQRVGIARALAQKPRLLLADEPVASLDPATAEAILDLVARICREDGLTAVVSLHQIDLARRFGDRVIGLGHGRVVFDGPPSALAARSLEGIYRPESSRAQKGIPDETPVPSLP